jgi:hypothetical protein
MLDDDDLLEAARLRRRRLLTALDHGSQGGDVPGQRTLRRLAAGIGVSALLALGAAVGGLVQASLHDQGAAAPAHAAAAAPRSGG